MVWPNITRKSPFEWSGLHTLNGHDRNFMKFAHSCYFDITTTPPFLSLCFCCISVQPHFIANDVIQEMGHSSQKRVAIFLSFPIVSTNNCPLIHSSQNSNITTLSLYISIQRRSRLPCLLKHY